MSHILKDKIDLDVVSYFYKNLDLEKLSTSLLEEILEEFLPRDSSNQLLINYDVREKGLHPAIFYPKGSYISLAIAKINKWLKDNASSLGRMYDISDIDSFSKYLFFYMLSHEVEHGFQYLMASDKVSSPCVLVRDGYKGIFDLFDKKDTIIPRPIKDSRRSISLFLYKLHENSYVLERNANVESLDLVCSLANHLNDRKNLFIFTNMLNTFIKCGYLSDYQGSFIETYRKILMGDKLSFSLTDSNFSFEEKIRYGLPISEEERVKVLSLCKSK